MDQGAQIPGGAVKDFLDGGGGSRYLLGSKILNFAIFWGCLKMLTIF